MSNDVSYTATSTTHQFPLRWQLPALSIWAMLLFLSFGIFLFGSVLYLLQSGDMLPFGIEHSWLPTLSTKSIVLYFWVIDTFGSLAFFAVAFFLFWRKRDSWLIMMVSLMLALFGGVFVNNTTYFLGNTAPVFGTLTLVLGLLGNTIFVLFLYTFPNGRFPSRIAQVLAIFAICWFVTLYAIPDLLINYLKLPESFIPFISTCAYGTSFILPSSMRRHQSDEQQQQVKWIYTGLGLALLGFILRFLPDAILPILHEPGTPRGIFLMIAQLCLQISLSLVPFAIGFSMLRYRLWDVDFLINRGLVYGTVTVTLGLLIAGLLFVMRQLFMIFTGQEQAASALVIAGIAAGALFQPIRQTLQRLVDQRLYGIQVIYQKPRPASAIIPADETVGKQVGSYTLQQLIGRGGMANVYLAQHPTLNQPVAIKMMLAEQATEADFRARFEREARAIASLRHENIVKLFDFGRTDETYYMVMEYINGPNLRSFLQQNQPLPWQTAVSLIQQIGAALGYAHAQGLVHRDIKPANVMIQEYITQTNQITYRAILTDFGIVKMMGGSSALTHTGLVGTLDYIAPEQIRDAKDVDGRADLYSLGVMAYEMVTGERPFSATNPGALLIAHLQQPAPNPRKLRPELPDSIAAIILQLLAKEPASRFATADDLLMALKIAN